MGIKRLASLVLVVMMVFTVLLSGCGNKAADQTATTAVNAPADTTAAEPAATAPKQITIKLGNWPEDTLKDDIAMFQNFVKQYNAKYPNVTIVPDYYKYAPDTFVAMASAGNLPTIFETWYTEPQKLINGSFVADITQEVGALGWQDALNPSIKALLSKDGKLYGLPRDGYALGLMLNMDLFSKAGLVDASGLPQYPKTWDELAATARTIKDKTGAAGLCLLAKDNAGGWHFSNIAWNFGAKFEAQVNGKWTAQLNSKEAVAAMNYVKDLKWKYNVLTPDPTNEDWGTGFKQLGTGACAMYIAANDGVNQPTQVNKLDAKKLALVPMPAGPGGQYSLMGGTPYMFSAAATPDEITAALNFLVVMGKAPVATPEAIAGMTAQAQKNVAAGVPNIPPFPAYVQSDYLKAQNDVIAANSNVDMALYNDYFNMIKKDGNLHLEEPQVCQDMYAELTKVLQAVVTDKNADVQKLLDTANTNVQKLLDAQVNK